MPTVKISFVLPEEQQELNSALEGAQWKSIVEHICAYLRDNRKYSDKDTISIIKLEKEIQEEIDSLNLTLYT